MKNYTTLKNLRKRYHLKQEGNGPKDERAQRSNLTSYLKSVTSITLVTMCILHPTAILVTSEAMVTSKWPQWPQESNLTSDLKSATSITLVYMCMLPVTAIFVASEAMATSK